MNVTKFVQVFEEKRSGEKFIGDILVKPFLFTPSSQVFWRNMSYDTKFNRLL